MIMTTEGQYNISEEVARNGVPKKVCRKCDTLKLLVDFNRNKKTQDGHRNQCRDCDQEYIRMRRSGEIDLADETKARRNEYEGPGEATDALLPEPIPAEELLLDGFTYTSKRHSCNGRIWSETLGKKTHYVCDTCGDGWEK